MKATKSGRKTLLYVFYFYFLSSSLNTLILSGSSTFINITDSIQWQIIPAFDLKWTSLLYENQEKVRRERFAELIFLKTDLLILFVNAQR